jgi:nicotinate-nucleotide adenylyltransferase
MSKITLFFGSFNPIHIGHLIIAQSVLNESETEQVWFVVSPQSPFKKSAQLLNENQRYFLVELAIQNNPKFLASNIEFGLPKPNYTIDTLAYLKEKFPLHEFSLLMGGDNIATIKQWKNYEKILENHRIYVYDRNASNLENAPQSPQIIFLEVPKIQISSTNIRGLIKNQKSIQYLVPDLVREEIEKSGYYL